MSGKHYLRIKRRNSNMLRKIPKILLLVGLVALLALIVGCSTKKTVGAFRSNDPPVSPGVGTGYGNGCA